MALMRAKENCYLGEDGYKVKGEEFEYSGPKHDSLEKVKAGKEAPVEPAEPETNHQ